MQFKILYCFNGAVGSVTVLAAVAAGIIAADVDALDAAALQALVFILGQLQRAVEQFTKKLRIYTVRMLYTILPQINAFCTGVQL